MSDPAPPDVTNGAGDEGQAELGRVYAEALLNAGAQTGQAVQVLDDLEELVADVWLTRPQFAAILESPALAAAEKERILRAAFQGHASPILLQFLLVLNKNGRMGLLRSVAREARVLWDRQQNRRHVSVRSAVPLDEGQLEALRARLAPLVRGTPVLHTQVDPGLIGGLVIQVDDFVYDASVRTGYLERFRRQLIERKAHEVLARHENFITT